MTDERSSAPGPAPALRRATVRPQDFARPAHWSNAPAPAPAPPAGEADPEGLSPTRYGDWTRNGIAIDF